MRIATFNSLEGAQDKLDVYNNLARHITSQINFSLVPIIRKSHEDIWWFNFDDCITNGGLGRDSIAGDEDNLTIIELTREDLTSQGYLPSVED